MKRVVCKNGDVFILSFNNYVKYFFSYSTAIDYVVENDIKIYKLWLRRYKNYIPISEFLLV